MGQESVEAKGGEEMRMRSFYLTEDNIGQLEAIAERRELTRSDIIRRLIEAAYKEEFPDEGGVAKGAKAIRGEECVVTQEGR